MKGRREMNVQHQTSNLYHGKVRVSSTSSPYYIFHRSPLACMLRNEYPGSNQWFISLTSSFPPFLKVTCFVLSDLLVWWEDFALCRFSFQQQKEILHFYLFRNSLVGTNTPLVIYRLLQLDTAYIQTQLMQTMTFQKHWPIKSKWPKTIKTKTSTLFNT